MFSVDRGYHDIWGNYKSCSSETLFKVVSAMGALVQNEGDIEAAVGLKRLEALKRLLPPVKVVFSRKEEEGFSIIITLPQKVKTESIQWELITEEGDVYNGESLLEKLKLVRSISYESETWNRYRLNFTLKLPLGYHKLHVTTAKLSGTCEIISAPDKSYEAPEFKEGKKLWGVAAQLYSLRSSRNWGLGQFSDLSALTRIVSEAGGAFVGLNPFNAVPTFNMDQNSPYSATSRSFLNVYYIDCEAMPDVQESSEAREVIASSKFQQKISQLRSEKQVQYRDVRALKNPVFELAYEHFSSTHMVKNTKRAKEFCAFVEQGGERLEQYAIFEALGMFHWKPDFSCWGWPVWKSEYMRPDSPAVKEFANENREDIDFFKFLQWQAHSQLKATVLRSKELGLPLGLYVDFALAGDRGGCDVWRYQDLHALKVSVGAPPDDYNLKGQDWGFSPLIPREVRKAAYRPFVEALRANMEYAGAIRIDHAMSMMRLFWIPEGDGPDKGTYVRYPYRDLMGIVSLESLRNKCVVVCEDLGTVPDVFREEMRKFGMLSYKVFFFMKKGPNEFCMPWDYPQDSLVTGTTHDMYTIWGYWKGLDLELREELKLLTGPPLKEQLQIREQEKKSLLNMLKGEGLLSTNFNIDSGLKKLSDEVLVAIEAFLARTPSRIMVVPIEDLTGQEPQVNLPGTTQNTYPSWSHRVPVNLQDIPAMRRFKELKKALKKEGRVIKKS